MSSRAGSCLRSAQLAALLLGSPPAFAQEIGLLAGVLQAPAEPRTYSWQIIYRQPFRTGAGLSFAWTNEGHLPGHHRDGYSLQAWYCLGEWGSGLSVAAGLGPYRYYDTVPGDAGGHRNRHGVGVQGTLQLLYTAPGSDWSWAGQVGAQRIAGEHDSRFLQLGAFRRLGPGGAPGRRPERAPAPAPRDGLGVFVGRTILNSLRSESADAWGVEYWRALTRHWVLLASYASEGDPELLRRDGLALQLWLGGSPGGSQLYLGVGAGPHFARVLSREPQSTEEERFLKLGLRVGMGAGWRLDPAWMLRASWHRTFSTYHRDTDQFVTGLTYLW